MVEVGIYLKKIQSQMFVVVFKDGAFPNIRKAQTGFSCWVKGPSYLTLA